MKLTSTDIRNATWLDVQKRVSKDMVEVHEAWQTHGPCTTRELAERSGLSLLTLRPRTTDLYQIGLVACEGKKGREGGVYKHVTHQTAAQTWQRRQLEISQKAQRGNSRASEAGRTLRAHRRAKRAEQATAGSQGDLFAGGVS